MVWAWDKLGRFEVVQAPVAVANSVAVLVASPDGSCLIETADGKFQTDTEGARSPTETATAVEEEAILAVGWLVPAPDWLPPKMVRPAR